MMETGAGNSKGAQPKGNGGRSGVKRKMTTSSRASIQGPSGRHSESSAASEMAQSAATVMKEKVETVNKKPLVVVVDGRDCTVEMGALKDIATVGFCDAKSIKELVPKAFNEAFALIMWNTFPLMAEDLDRFMKLKMIVRLATHVDDVDLVKASELGICVCAIPGVGIDATANATLSYILNFYSGTFWTANAVKGIKKIWTPEDALKIGTRSQIRGEVLGIVGMGHVGQAVGARAKAFGFDILFYDPYAARGVEQATGFRRAHTLEDLLTAADCVTLHCSLNEFNHQMIDAETIRHMRPGAYFVNTAHEALVDEEALATALKNGYIKGAAIDVHSGPPGDVIGPLKHAPNLIVTPNSAFLEPTTYLVFRQLGAAEIRNGLIGDRPHCFTNCVNKDLFLQARANIQQFMDAAIQLRNEVLSQAQATQNSGSVSSGDAGGITGSVPDPEEPEHSENNSEEEGDGTGSGASASKSNSDDSECESEEEGEEEKLENEEPTDPIPKRPRGRPVMKTTSFGQPPLMRESS